MFPEKFQKHVCGKGPESCWIWTGPRRGKYGAFSTHYAHRWALEFFCGIVIPTGMETLHVCDIPLCVNPLHLVLGTRGQNRKDMHDKGRAAGNQRRPSKCSRQNGTENSASKLTDQDVVEIRRLYSSGTYTQSSLASRFGICQPTVSDIVNRKLWRHLT